MKQYSYFRSGTSYRLRIALRLKGLEAEYVPVDLTSEEHLEPDFKAINPQGLVPALVHDGQVLIQSPAIIEWLLEYLRHELGCDETAVLRWCGTWIQAGFDALEALLADDKKRGAFCFGDAPTIADVYLVPQVASARRFKVDLEPWPIIRGIDAACSELEAFRLAAPASQPDAA